MGERPHTDDRLIAKLREVAKRPMTRKEVEEQRRAYARAEAGFGSDADEAAYASALARGDKAEIERLDLEAQNRMAAVDRYYSDGSDDADA